MLCSPLNGWRVFIEWRIHIFPHFSSWVDWDCSWVPWAWVWSCCVMCWGAVATSECCGQLATHLGTWQQLLPERTSFCCSVEQRLALYRLCLRFCPRLHRAGGGCPPVRRDGCSLQSSWPAWSHL